MKTLSTKNLLIAFAVLAIVCGIIYFFTGQKDNGNFKTTEINLDASTIDQWIITPQQNPAKAYRIFRDGKRWKIELPDKEIADAGMDIIERSIHHFVNLKPESLVATTKKEWRQYGVDTAGTLVQVFESRQQKYAFIIGDITFQNDKLATYYFRLQNEDNVYTVHNYLDGSIRATPDAFRKKDLLIASPDILQFLSFNYTNEPTFRLENTGNAWQINGQNIDSARINPYLRALCKFRLTAFTSMPAGAPYYSISVSSNKSKETITLDAFRQPNGKWTVTSSANKGNYFVADSATVMNHFPPKRIFQ